MPTFYVLFEIYEKKNIIYLKSQISSVNQCHLDLASSKGQQTIKNSLWVKAVSYFHKKVDL